MKARSARLLRILPLRSAARLDDSAPPPQLAGQGLEFAELSDFIFRLMNGCRRGQILSNGLTLHFLSELKMRAVSGVVGFGAMATGTSAAAGSPGDGTRLEVAQFGNLLE